MCLCTNLYTYAYTYIGEGGAAACGGLCGGGAAWQHSCIYIYANIFVYICVYIYTNMYIYTNLYTYIGEEGAAACSGLCGGGAV